MRTTRSAAALLLALFPAACTTTAVDLATCRFVDLTHAFDEDAVYWPTASGFTLHQDSKGMTDNGYWYEANSFSTAEHGGTHLDAPVHFAKDAHTADAIPVRQLVGPAVVVDVRSQCGRDPDYQVRVDDLEAHERAHGRIPPGAIVLLWTGFSTRWPDRARYLGTDERGQAATLKLHFPGLHPAAAIWLCDERQIDAVGIDTASIDHGPSRLFHSHRELFRRQVPAFENIAALDGVPPTGAFVVALPMKIRGGSGGPLRIVAALP